jgi:hypothetical protein
MFSVLGDRENGETFIDPIYLGVNVYQLTEAGGRGDVGAGWVSPFNYVCVRVKL